MAFKTAERTLTFALPGTPKQAHLKITRAGQRSCSDGDDFVAAAAISGSAVSQVEPK